LEIGGQFPTVMVSAKRLLPVRGFGDRAVLLRIILHYRWSLPPGITIEFGWNNAGVFTVAGRSVSPCS
jgi:hypothetical protein